MGVTKHGKPLGLQLMGKGRGSSNVVHGLSWQTIHKINIDLVYANPAQNFDCLLDD